MSDEHRVHLFEWGEAYDDLRAAFFIDERAYADPEAAQRALATARSIMDQLGVIYEEETSAGTYATQTWEQFWQRYIVDGETMPVRPRPRKVEVPPSWDEMSRAVDAQHLQFREYLMTYLGTIFPAEPPTIELDHGPLRRSPASIDWSEEKYGFEIHLRAETPGVEPNEAVARAGASLEANGWTVTAGDNNSLTADRDSFTIWLSAQPGYVSVHGNSPLYRAPREPGSTYVVESRP